MELATAQAKEMTYFLPSIRRRRSPAREDLTPIDAPELSFDSVESFFALRETSARLMLGLTCAIYGIQGVSRG